MTSEVEGCVEWKSCSFIWNQNLKELTLFDSDKVPYINLYRCFRIEGPITEQRVFRGHIPSLYLLVYRYD
jgi:hypothetical protein